MASQLDVGPTSDYECFIHVHNNTSVSLSLDNSGAVDGEYAKGSPPTLIRSNTEAIIRLNDRSWKPIGSEGWALYELYPPHRSDKPVQIFLEFADPMSPVLPNYLHARVSEPELVSYVIRDYNSSGHPFEAHIEISLTGETATHGEEENYTYDDNLAMHGNSSTVFRRSSGPVNALFKIGFDGLLGLGTFPPIHEDITIAAFIKSNLRTQFPRGTNYTNLSEESWEFFRGVIWCDDPSCLLFVDSETDNRLFGAGTDFGSQFEFGDPTCLTRRSHFGNLQFLHGMATRFNETPTETKANILRWLEVMYKLAIGNQGIAETDRLDQRLPSAMSGSPLPPNGGQTLRDLLLGTTPSYRTADISKRALGVCLHMLQDSYAVGHTLRRLLNIEDLDGKDGKGYVRFKPDKYARLGSIITFHTYNGQNDKRHAHYDYDDLSPKRTPRDPSTFNYIIGAYDAIEMSTKLINHYAAKTKWEGEGGVCSFFDTEVFPLDRDVEPSNTDVDERFGLPKTSRSPTVTDANSTGSKQHQERLPVKVALLESGLAYLDGSSKRDGLRFSRILRQPCSMFLAFVGWFILMGALIIAFVVAQLLTGLVRLL